MSRTDIGSYLIIVTHNNRDLQSKLSPQEVQTLQKVKNQKKGLVIYTLWVPQAAVVEGNPQAYLQITTQGASRALTTCSHPKARNTDKKWAYNIENKFLGEKLPEGSASSYQHQEKLKLN